MKALKAFILMILSKGLMKTLKLVFTIFYQFIFSQNDSPLKIMKNVFYFI